MSTENLGVRNHTGRIDGGDVWVPISWQRASVPIHLDPETYVPMEYVPDEIRTRLNADRNRPHDIPGRPDPMPDPDTIDFVNDPAFWEFAEEVRLCDQCSEPFLAHSHNHRYCSVGCQNLSVSRVGLCGTCGKEFTSRFASQRFCSRECYNTDRRSKKG